MRQEAFSSVRGLFEVAADVVAVVVVASQAQLAAQELLNSLTLRIYG